MRVAFRAGLAKVNEAAELALAVRVVAQNERRKILTANVAVILVDFHCDISVADDVRPRFRQANGLRA
jgi:hypothetical protein